MLVQLTNSGIEEAFSFHCLPLSLGERPWLRLVARDHMWQKLSVGKQIIFVDLDWSERKAIADRRYTSLKLFSPILSFIQDKRNNYVFMHPAYCSNTLISFQPVELLRSKTVKNSLACINSRHIVSYIRLCFISWVLRFTHENLCN